MNNVMYFGRGAELVSCLRWVCEVDKESNLPTGSPYTFTHLKQTSPTQATCTARGKENAWFVYHCPSTGVVGSEYLLKGEDIVSRMGTEELFKNYPLVLSPTKRQKAQLKSVLELNNKDADCGITECATYAGDLSDFSRPERVWERVATLGYGWEFKRTVKHNQDLSDLHKNNTTNEGPPCLLYFNKGKLAIASAEMSGSLNGTNMIITEMSATFSKPLTVAMRGRFLAKICDLIDKENPAIQVFVDNVDEPTRLKFEGVCGLIDVPTIPLHTCNALSQGALAYFYGDGLKSNREISNRHFLSEPLSGFIGLQCPAQSSNPDILLEMEGNKLVIAKREENSKRERSTVTTWGLEGKGDWLPVIVKHHFLRRSVEVMSKYIAAEIERSRMEYCPTDFDDDDEDDTPEFNVLELRQCAVKPGKKEINVLFIESPVYKSCRILLICNTLPNANE